ncbi:hypothetical protein HA402_001809 [Bradysia odoriphaga]|nr:hypothetical protein HA402_001809 [Bradysia odoriphaga]
MSTNLDLSTSELSKFEFTQNSDVSGCSMNELCEEMFLLLLLLLLQSTYNNCTVVHIASVCAGTNSTRSLLQMVKSILYYRSSPLHFHILTDVGTEEHLKNSFQKWNLPKVTLSFYDNKNWISKVAWIPNQHYSGVYGLLKLMLPEALQNIDKVLVLDTDITFLTDVSNLWQNFDKFNGHQMLGLVENQSDMYTKLWVTGARPWPAIGNGFNTGVILMDLKRIRDRNFFSMWMATCEKLLIEYRQVRTADQDIINATIKDNAPIVFTLDCTWNVQLSDHTRSDQCYGDGKTIQILHWNSRHKQRVKNKHSKTFRSVYRFFLEMDENLLRRRLLECENGTIS